VARERIHSGRRDYIHFRTIITHSHPHHRRRLICKAKSTSDDNGRSRSPRIRRSEHYHRPRENRDSDRSLCVSSRPGLGSDVAESHNRLGRLGGSSTVTINGTTRDIDSVLICRRPDQSEVRFLIKYIYGNLLISPQSRFYWSFDDDPSHQFVWKYDYDGSLIVRSSYAFLKTFF
jgi:hypothetical protein